MSILNTIRFQCLDIIRPTESDIQESAVVFEKVRKAIKLEAEERNIAVAFINLEGSSGRKQTQLRGWKELDIFIGLPASIVSNSLENKKTRKPLIRRLLKKMVKDVAVNAVKRVGSNEFEIAYAEHPYVIAKIDNYRVDIVFCFDLTKNYIVENGPITAVDRTPHHSNFVDKHLTVTQRDDVRLLKAFFHTSYVYGDSSPVGRSGFTGFSTEMLIFHSQALEPALEYLSQSAPQPLDFFSRDADSLKRKFTNDFFIISDPVDPNRNIASSISKRAYRYTRHRARQLLLGPSEVFFDRQPIPQLSKAELDLLEPNYFVIEFQDQTGWHYTKTRDKLYSYFSTLARFLRQEPTGESRFGSTTFEELFRGKIFAVALYVEKAKVSQTYTRAGPPENQVEGVNKFIEKHPDAFLKNGRYYTKINRAFTSAEKALRYYLSENQLSSELPIIDVTRTGSTEIGAQALWILKQAVLPFVTAN
jgi:tRNA nucleotidyltransferase (CCA-adding enzyme)